MIWRMFQKPFNFHTTHRSRDWRHKKWDLKNIYNIRMFQRTCKNGKCLKLTTKFNLKKKEMAFRFLVTTSARWLHSLSIFSTSYSKGKKRLWNGGKVVEKEEKISRCDGGFLKRSLLLPFQLVFKMKRKKVLKVGQKWEGIRS